ncbi:Subtilase family protein [Granulicella rosea]|uniref:Subtilase family protein n=1 Tax=Granulicella rosea TaxID=474952 RepID=A0A239J6Z0_9BACT|nr:S8 family serine peptidase [Granulicella rosea]SNT01585.1 Subtilase family protein [Granulicella rosea]
MHLPKRILLATAALFITACAQAQQHRLLVVYRDGVVPADAELRAHAAGARMLRRHDRLGIALIGATDTASAKKTLAAQTDVEAVVEDRVLSATSITISNLPIQINTLQSYDGLYNTPQGWAVRAAGGAPTQWATTQGKGVRIAILDSGVDATHPDLAPNLALNLSEIDQTALPSPCDDGTPQDQTGHGSWTASLAAGALGPGTGDVAGVAPAATILNIKVLERLPAVTGDATTCGAGQASGLLSWVLQGIDDAVANRADVISMSLGTLVDLSTGDGAGLKATFDRVTYAASQAGVILIAAAGNDGVDLSNPRYIELPAQARGVVAITASTNPDCAENLLANAACVAGAVTMPYYSNYGAPLNALSAPGGSYPEGPANDVTKPTGWIVGACSSGLAGTQPSTSTIDQMHSYGCFGLGHQGYVQAMGTSASAALAAGSAALIRAAHPTWDAATVIAAMYSTAVNGQINTASAVALP